jgi:hypothetical protein
LVIGDFLPLGVLVVTPHPFDIRQKAMGLFWDLYQQSQISDHSRRSEDLEGRVADLERQLDSQQQLLREVIARLETHVGKDLDADGQIGGSNRVFP